MLVHKYEVGDKVKWYLKRATGDDDLSVDKETEPVYGAIKEIRDDIHEDTFRLLYPNKDFKEEMPFYVVEANMEIGALKGKVDIYTPMPKFFIPEDELFESDF